MFDDIHIIQYFNGWSSQDQFTQSTINIEAVSAAPARFPTSNRYCTGGRFILLFNLLSLKLASLPEP